MKVENQVCTIEQGIALRKLGISQNSLFYYYRGLKSQDHGIQPKSYFNGTTSMNASYSLFTAAELGVMLPAYFEVIKQAEKSDTPNYFITIQVNHNDSCECCRVDTGVRVDSTLKTTEAQSKAEMLIIALEQGVLTASDCNNRLNG